jgi:hypothetical protein
MERGQLQEMRSEVARAVEATKSLGMPAYARVGERMYRIREEYWLGKVARIRIERYNGAVRESEGVTRAVS